MKLFFRLLGTYLKHFLGIWNEPRRYQQLYDFIGEIHPKNILEIGTWRGKRARAMISEAKNYSPVGQIHYYGFDLFEDLSKEALQSEFSKQPPLANIVKNDLLETGVKVELYKGDTRKTLPENIASLPKMDFIFIDGGHSLETIQNDWKYTSLLMHEKTVVVFDDYWPDRTDGGAKPIVDAIDQSIYNVRILPEFDVFIKPKLERLIIEFAMVKKHQ